jgi:hypothetical protein
MNRIESRYAKHQTFTPPAYSKIQLSDKSATGPWVDSLNWTTLKKSGGAKQIWVKCNDPFVPRNLSGYSNVSVRRTLTGADEFNQTITPISSSSGFITSLYVVFINNTSNSNQNHDIEFYVPISKYFCNITAMQPGT